jgi:hypothetical protein
VVRARNCALQRRHLDSFSADADARHEALSLKRLLSGLICCAFLFADGGTLLFTRQDGSFVVTLFGAPEPIRAGTADMSVLVQRASDREPVLDAQVQLRLTRAGFDPLEVRLSHANATNKLLYAGSIQVPAAGVWKAEVSVYAKQGSARLSGELQVLTPQPPLIAYWPYFALVPLMIGLYALNQWLKRRRAVRPRARA